VVVVCCVGGDAWGRMEGRHQEGCERGGGYGVGWEMGRVGETAEERRGRKEGEKEKGQVNANHNPSNHILS